MKIYFRGYSINSSYSDEYEERVSGLINYRSSIKDPKTGEKRYTINQDYGYPIYRNNDTGEEIVPANIEDIKETFIYSRTNFLILK